MGASGEAGLWRARRTAPASATQGRDRSVRASALPHGTTISDIPIQQIDLNDRRFQLRLRPRNGELKRSIETEGQQIPVTLWGERAPYRIIDGFGRVDAIVEIGLQTVAAIVRCDIDEDDAFMLSFIENVKRSNFTPLDKANAIWIATTKRGMSKQDVATEFSLSTRQVTRYLRMLDFDPLVKHALVEDRITMAQAAVLHHAHLPPADLVACLKRVEQRPISARDLQRSLRRPKIKPRSYLTREPDGFRTAVRYRTTLPTHEKQRIVEALEFALTFAHHDLTSVHGQRGGDFPLPSLRARAG